MTVQPQSQREAGRRALVTLVKECVALANDCNAAVAELQKKHNTLTQQTGADVPALGGRIDAQGKWIGQIEGRLAAESTRLANLVKNLQTQIEIGATRQRAFATMTFRQRLVWYFTGRCPFYPLTWTEERTEVVASATDNPNRPGSALDHAIKAPLGMVQ
jgi:hypothetical protein